MKRYRTSKSKYPSLRFMTEAERLAEIERLETLRLYVTADIEDVMNSIAILSGKKKFRLKKKKVGRRAQDYIPFPEYRR